MKYFTLTLAVALLIGLITCQNYETIRESPSFIKNKILRRGPQVEAAMMCLAMPFCDPAWQKAHRQIIAEPLVQGWNPAWGIGLEGLKQEFNPKVQQELIAPYPLYYGPGPVVYPFPDVQMVEAGGIKGWNPRWGHGPVVINRGPKVESAPWDRRWGIGPVIVDKTPVVESMSEDVDDLYVDSPYWDSRWGIGPVIMDPVPKVERSSILNTYNTIANINRHKDIENINNDKDFEKKTFRAISDASNLIPPDVQDKHLLKYVDLGSPNNYAIHELKEGPNYKSEKHFMTYSSSN
ncbi:UNKNOWN [Stylonychia lemnae]|uniref:Uncharacterized protein n=1 Tax=Stylonychia lemnae TaxID=5949 RepID=A0A077ZRJ1_STYLE|nr:UNKNOWN [Stylonychia lemnae]|eukprot:CDW72533.1 UNKNOWN [Stylonychia lemnae]